MTAPVVQEGGHDGGGAVAAYHAARVRSGQPGLDELVAPDGQTRPAARDLAASVDLLGTGGLLARRAQARRLIEDDGVTYGPAAPGGAVRRWSVDPLPVVLDAATWAALVPGVVERAELLDAVLTDLYGRRALLRSGVVPAELVLAHPGYLRPADGVRVPGARQLFLAATDLGRTPDGSWTVVADRTQAPSGAGYAMENRRVVSRVMPGLYRDTPLERLRAFFHVVRAALQEVAPTTAEAPRVVLLTPGAGNETAFDQAFLATLLGYPLVEAEDLTVRDGRVWMRSLGRLEPVDVVLRRVDAWFADPLELRPDSTLGVPGLLEAARAGTVSVVNPFGAGVLENPGLLPYLPAAGRLLLGREPALASVPTFWCGDDVMRAHVLARLEHLVLKPVWRGVGRASVFGWELSGQQRDDLRHRIESEPAAWVGQEPVQMSTAPAVTGRGLEARHLVVRTFAVAHAGGYHLMAGGLGRVAGRAGSRFVASSDGALAKDVWVLSTDAAGIGAAALGGVGDTLALVATDVAAPGLSPRVAEDLFWLGRYAERAEDTARLLRVADDLAEDYGRGIHPDGSPALAVLLAAVSRVTATDGLLDDALRGPAGADDDETPGYQTARAAPPVHAGLLRLAVDPGTAGTLAFAVRRTVEVAHALREQLSLDTWLVLGSLDRVLDDLAQRARAAVEGDSPPLQPTVARVLEGLLALAGLGAESMVWDTGWHFMDLGRRLERALALLGLLRHTLVRAGDAGVEALVLESVLTAAESIITYRRRTATGPGPGGPGGGVPGALHLLLLDRTNPRALAHQLDRVETDLRNLPPGRRGDDLRGVARRLSARLREADAVALARTDESGRRPALKELLDVLAGEVADLALAVEAVHFVHVAPLRPLPVSTPGWTP